MMESVDQTVVDQTVEAGAGLNGGEHVLAPITWDLAPAVQDAALEEEKERHRRR